MTSVLPATVGQGLCHLFSGSHRRGVYIPASFVRPPFTPLRFDSRTAVKFKDALHTRRRVSGFRTGSHLLQSTSSTKGLTVLARVGMWCERLLIATGLSATLANNQLTLENTQLKSSAVRRNSTWPMVSRVTTRSQQTYLVHVLLIKLRSPSANVHEPPIGDNFRP